MYGRQIIARALISTWKKVRVHTYVDCIAVTAVTAAATAAAVVVIVVKVFLIISHFFSSLL